jgi:hypothetical protein
MDQKRKFQRFPVQLDARCFGAGESGHRTCKITEISRQGILLKLHLHKEIPEGQNVALEIALPPDGTIINALAKVKWVKDSEAVGPYDYTVGAQMTMIQPEDKKRLLHYAYEDIIDKEKHDRG